MTALASTDVTITVVTPTRDNRYRDNLCKVEFGNGTLTYPANGVPLPSFASFGMRKQLISLSLVDQDDASGIIWKYDQGNHKLRGYIQGIIVSAAGAATVDDFPLDTTSDPLATAVSLSLTNNTGAGTKYLGKLIELATTHAPATQTLYFRAHGQ
jgi:hypothetical protein